MSLAAQDDSLESRFRDGEEEPEEDERCGCGEQAVCWSAYHGEHFCAECKAEREPVRLDRNARDGW